MTDVYKTKVQLFSKRPKIYLLPRFWKKFPRFTMTES